jgi:MFS family permease
MAEKETPKHENIESVSTSTHHHIADFEPPTKHTNESAQADHIDLTWRSWLVVLISCFAIMAQVFVVVAAGSVIAFIIRDLGEPNLAGWIIQGPLLMQAALSPAVGRLSDVLDRKWLATIPPLIAAVGAIISAKATSMSMLIGGGILIGVTLSTIAIVQAIPAEVLPLKYRALANGFAFLGGAVGGLVGGLGSGAVTNANAGGWRAIFWMQTAFHLFTSLSLLLFYHPKQGSDYGKMSAKAVIWACDPIGSMLFIIAATLLLLALDWTGGAYAWSDPHVAAPLALGFFFLLLFCIYEWKGRSDGMVTHAFFKGSPNFALSVFAFGVEGWLFYSAVNSITPQIVLNLGWENNAWDISIRQLSYQLPALFFSIPITLYATKFKDLKSPLIVTFLVFLVVTICYSVVDPSMGQAQYAFNVLSGIGQSGPLTLLVACVQFTAPHAFLSTATGLAFSARAIGGAFGSAVLNAIINGKLSSTYANKVGGAALGAGLPRSSVGQLLEAFSTGEGFDAVPGANAAVLEAATHASHWAYARAYRLAWVSIVPFVVVATIAVACLKGVKQLMTEKVESTVEKVETSKA